MNSLVFGHPAQCAAAANGMAGLKLPVEFWANVAMVAAAVGSSGLVLFALNAAFAAH